MKLTLIILFFPILLFGQETTYVKTDSSVIKTKYFKYLNSIREFNELNDIKRTYYKDYFYNSKSIKEEGVFFNGHSVGIWKEFDSTGTLIREINHDLGIWRIENKTNYPFYDLQNSMKEIGDSLIISTYGKEFFEENVIWSLDGSYIYNKDESGRWTDSFKVKPNKFLLRYNIKLDADHIYEDLIEFELDSLGKYIPNKYEEVYGFEKVKENQKGKLKINIKNCLRIAKKNGLVVSDTLKPQSFLKWENEKTDNFFKGRFRYYVLLKTKTIENIVPNGRSSRITKYDVYSFNPWTGEFIEKKKMKTHYGWEKHSGSGTGLLPDEE